ncbi:MAG: methionine--tRNA ligase [Phycisphaeraceae bacterium]|nr:methionine--tRNA ligase [Phycisphaeraceae bacterium]
MSNAGAYYITTPIYYVNDRPHIGHCYTTVLADVAARFHRLMGREVFFLTGTDEHADKVVTSAAEHGVSPQAWADRNAAAFKEAFAFLGCTNDDFIRTTEARHREKVSAYISRLIESGAVYKGEYTGWYDAGQEEYVTDTAAREADYKSTVNGKALIKRTEPCYFFRLSRYQGKLRALIEERPEFIRPDARRQEVLGRLRPPAELHDVPISRPVTDDPATQWGIRIPGDDAHRVYVWIDALFNYLSVVDTSERRKFWPATVHLIGKDILWFHAVIWPAVLLALGEPLPRTVFGHGWWIAEGQKMSKSLGNFIDLEKVRAYASRYSLDALRWFLSTQGPLTGNDADFGHAKFVETYNADLANGIGNCASRVANMIDKYFGGAAPDAQGVTALAGHDWPRIVGELTTGADGAAHLASRFDLHGALRSGVELVRKIDGYINTTAPFKLAKHADDDPLKKRELAVILYHCAEAIRIAAYLFWPAMPWKMDELLTRWGCPTGTQAVQRGLTLADLAAWAGEHGLKAGAPISKGEAGAGGLFNRADAAEVPPGT